MDPRTGPAAPGLLEDVAALACDLARLARAESALALRAALGLLGLLPALLLLATGAWLSALATLWWLARGLAAPPALAALLLLAAHGLALWQARRAWHRWRHAASLPRLRASLRELTGRATP